MLLKRLSRLKPTGRWPVICLALVLAAPALAASLKSLMQEMGDTARLAKSAAGSGFELSQAQSILEAFATQGQAGESLYAGRPDAKSHDFSRRFARLVAIADGGRATVKDRAGFRTAFTAVAGECRSCHSVYK